MTAPATTSDAPLTDFDQRAAALLTTSSPAIAKLVADMRAKDGVKRFLVLAVDRSEAEFGAAVAGVPVDVARHGTTLLVESLDDASSRSGRAAHRALFSTWNNAPGVVDNLIAPFDFAEKEALVYVFGWGTVAVVQASVTFLSTNAPGGES